MIMAQQLCETRASAIHNVRFVVPFEKLSNKSPLRWYISTWQIGTGYFSHVTAQRRWLQPALANVITACVHALPADYRWPEYRPRTVLVSAGAVSLFAASIAHAARSVPKEKIRCAVQHRFRSVVPWTSPTQLPAVIGMPHWCSLWLKQPRKVRT